MSASREKKQRQAAPSYKSAQTNAEQAAYRRKVRTYTVIGVVVVVLVAALLIWNSGFFQRRTAAASIGESTINVAELSFYYNDIRMMYANAQLLDTSKSDEEQMYSEDEGLTYRDYFLENALAQAKNVKALCDAALADGYSMEDVQEDLDAQIESTKSAALSAGYSYKSYIRANYGKYMTASVYEDLLAQSLLASLYSNDIQEETSASFTDEDLDAYYQEHQDEVDTFEYSYLYFKTGEVKDTDAEGNDLSEEEVATLTQEAKDAAKAKAEEALTSYQNGTLVAKLITQSSPDQSADHTKVTGSTSISSIYREQLLELGQDEATVVENGDSGYYLVIYHGRGRDESVPATIRDILIRVDSTTDEEGNVVAPSQEEMDTAKAQAEELLAQWESGDKTQESFAALAEEHSDSTTASNGGLTTRVTQGVLTDDRDSWLFDETRTPGDVTLVEHQGDTSSSSSYWGYHITYFQEWEEMLWKQNVRSSLTSDAMTEWNDGLMAEGYDTALLSGANYLGR